MGSNGSGAPPWSFSFFNFLTFVRVNFTVGLTTGENSRNRSTPVVKRIEIYGDNELLMDFNLKSKGELTLTKFYSENLVAVLAMTGAFKDYILNKYYKASKESIEDHLQEIESSVLEDLKSTDFEEEAIEDLLSESGIAPSEAAEEAFSKHVLSAYQHIQDQINRTLEDEASLSHNPSLSIESYLLGVVEEFATCLWSLNNELKEEFREPKRTFSIKGKGLNLSLDHQRSIISSTASLEQPEEEEEELSFDSENIGEEYMDMDSPDESPVRFFSHYFPARPINALAKAFRFDLETLVAASLESAKYWLTSTEYIGPYRSIPERFFYISKDLEATEVDQGYQTIRRIAESQKLVKEITEIFQDVLHSPYRMEVKTVAPSMNLKDLENELIKQLDVKGGKAEPTSIVRNVLKELSSGKESLGVYLVDTRNNAQVDFCDVGFGISQVLPLIAEVLKAEAGMVCIEQPEVHLHPKMQSDLADIFLKYATKRKGYNESRYWGDDYRERFEESRFILETHSEHIILRLLRRIRETVRSNNPSSEEGIRPEDVSVAWVSGGARGSVVTPLEISSKGKFIDDWPEGFFEERLKEIF